MGSNQTEIIVALSELAKLALIGVMQYMRMAGMDEAQIEEAYQKAKAAMLDRDPAKIPG